MDIPLKKPLKTLATGALRIAAMAHFGPLGGALMLGAATGVGKILTKTILADTELAEFATDKLSELTSEKAKKLFESVIEDFSHGQKNDLDESMLLAARKAVAKLKPEAPSGFDDWFDSWQTFLATKPAAEVFAGARNLDPVTLSYDDAQFRDLWWSRMEPVLAGWRSTQQSSITRMNLAGDAKLPPDLTGFLRDRLPEAMEEAHAEVLRDEKLESSWIAFQQHVYHDTLNHLAKMSTQLDRIELKLDGKLTATTIWTIPHPTEHFQDRPDLIAEIDAALARNRATALIALHGLGGIGKTQMARKFAELRRTNYKLAVWIESETKPPYSRVSQPSPA